MDEQAHQTFSWDGNSDEESEITKIRHCRTNYSTAETQSLIISGIQLKFALSSSHSKSEFTFGTMDADGDLCEETPINEELRVLTVFSVEGILAGFTISGDQGAVYYMGETVGF